ncbi:hypothetical protein ACIOUE_35605 [Streptomyces xanthochromogenes]|uniref:hypothetical protein n=1 Tax=Streptomyces xanthochromogenes TaxID=67384 RepID=UPI00380D1EE5
MAATGVMLTVMTAVAHAAPTPPASPSPSPSPSASADHTCDLIYGQAHDLCVNGRQHAGSGGGSGGGAGLDPGATTDPMTSLANACAKTAGWVVTQLGKAVDSTGAVDFTNGQFVKTYALVFAASTFLTLLLWLWAVAKRAVRGAPLTTAIAEAVGLLWLTVLASAFTPLVLYTVVQAVDGITAALSGAGGGQGSQFFKVFADALQKTDESGPIGKMILALVSIAAAGVVWLEMVIRAALLYCGAVLGTVVYSGLVDKSLWSRVRKWVAIMSAIILVKPVITIVLMLASALTGSNGPSTNSTSAIVSGLAIIILAIVASALIFRLIPGMGDEIVAARRDSYDPASKQAAAVLTRPVSGIRQGINTHATRDAMSRPSAPQPSQGASSNGASSGISTHSTRPSSSGGAEATGPRSARPDLPYQGNRDETRRP